MFYHIHFFVKDDVFNQLDFDTTVRLQDNLPKNMIIFVFFSLIGSFEILAGLLFLLPSLGKKSYLSFIFIPLAAAHVIEIIGKSLMNHPASIFIL